jgi:hypothetical protein
MAQTIILGCDPGFGGALAWYDPTARRIVAALPMPLRPAKTLIPDSRPEIDAEALYQQIYVSQPAVVVVERVNASPQQGVTSAFRFGEGFGIILGVLAGCGLKPRLAYPNVWKAGLGLSADKKQSLKMACELFPEWTPRFMTGARSADLAEAALLAYYGVRFLAAPIAETAKS